MVHFFTFIISALQITLLNIVLSGDNIGAIALVVRNLKPEDAKKASIIGISAAILLRIFFACVITFIMSLEWLPVKLIGGILLLIITWTLINEGYGETDNLNVKRPGSFKKAVIKIILTDISMSLDNVIAIGGAANGRYELITLGVIFTIPIILFGSQFVVSLMRKYKIAVYLGGAVLVQTALAMILGSQPAILFISETFAIIIRWAASASLLLYGIIKLKRERYL